MFLRQSAQLSCVSLVLLAVSWAIAAEQEIIYSDSGVCSKAVSWGHPRVKRQTIQRQSGFTNDEKMAILQRHNDLRAKEGSSNMRRMHWDSALEVLAQSYSEKCDFKHSPLSYRTNVLDFKYIGENIYAGTATFDPLTPVQLWWDEYTFYDFNTRRCTGVCGHYTQVVWDKSFALGCGFHYCKNLTGAPNFNRGYNVVCHYGPGGNIAGLKPYLKGEACTACPKETAFCVNGLCASTGE
ncbi:unnamed protein product [Lymnaea stagnalis]|uniref:SCP domain-containing protein n=1 Tax=Lymnaea stagnalis TaxID=6523 RepID=A0AAV2HXR7_LYMST